MDLDEIEIAKAWSLWNSLHEYATILWERYEQPFSKLLEDRNILIDGPFEIEIREEDIPY